DVDEVLTRNRCKHIIHKLHAVLEPNRKPLKCRDLDEVLTRQPGVGAYVNAVLEPNWKNRIGCFHAVLEPNWKNRIGNFHPVLVGHGQRSSKRLSRYS